MKSIMNMLLALALLACNVMCASAQSTNSDRPWLGDKRLFEIYALEQVKSGYQGVYVNVAPNNSSNVTYVTAFGSSPDNIASRLSGQQFRFGLLSTNDPIGIYTGFIDADGYALFFGSTNGMHAVNYGYGWQIPWINIQMEIVDTFPLKVDGTVNEAYVVIRDDAGNIIRRINLGAYGNRVWLPLGYLGKKNMTLVISKIGADGRLSSDVWNLGPGGKHIDEIRINSYAPYSMVENYREANDNYWPESYQLYVDSYVIVDDSNPGRKQNPPIAKVQLAKARSVYVQAAIYIKSSAYGYSLKAYPTMLWCKPVGGGDEDPVAVPVKNGGATVLLEPGSYYFYWDYADSSIFESEVPPDYGYDGITPQG